MYVFQQYLKNWTAFSLCFKMIPNHIHANTPIWLDKSKLAAEIKKKQDNRVTTEEFIVSYSDEIRFKCPDQDLNIIRLESIWLTD